MSFRLLVAAAAARRVGVAPGVSAHPRRHAAFTARRGFSFTAPRQGGQTLVEKIAQRHAVGLGEGEVVRSGDFIAIRPRHIMTHDNTGAVIPKFKSIGATRLADPQQPVFALDHDIQNTGEKNQAKYRSIEQFAHAHGNRFYPAGRGIAHQVLVEEGHAWPGTMVVGSDSHSNMYGGIGCLGTPVVRTDAAAIWATSQTWWQAPPVAKVELLGTLPPGVVGKDVIVALCGLFSKDEVLNHAVEFVGEGTRSLPVEDRLAIANMTTEWGALAGLFAVDDVTLQWYDARARSGAASPAISPKTVAALRASINSDASRWAPDSDAVYAKHLWLDLSSLTPHVSGPDTVKAATPLAALERKQIAINKAYIVSCVNSRAKDLREAADVVRAVQRAHPGVPVKAADGVAWYVAAASSQVMAEAQAAGDWQVLVDAGAKTLPPGCGPCIGLGVGLLEDGEVGISATNRNYKGRMGSKKAHTYLSSPAVVAASALQGFICSPATAIKGAIDAATVHSVRFGIKDSAQQHKAPAVTASDAIQGFPKSLDGRLVFLPADNLNTDGIYPGKYTYQDDITREQMKLIVMENYDPEFSRIVQSGDIVVAGANFGTGSSREQAATALLAAGIRLVICESASETFKRNAVNNGLLVLESPRLVQWLRSQFQTPNAPLTVATSLNAHVALVHGTVELRDDSGSLVYEGSLPRIGKAAQEIIVAGGLENWVRARMSSSSSP
ncbi:mitochondrial Homoaconitase [Coemansia sp. RSA 989]|nr:homoaconitase [Coemansia mojavensis]KAJ1740241.1 mitochondrial Homoaconitase [Coemansia sp. RSA 1086]KAJ1748123.1 mitochondrial Homoaconitase [Coemansia sp. RSA 1821]KAJ1868360.1 mitochondrial Homoaconitase [Coemansia sp. RSA 989]KAJ1870179.1 mitochondrial Homoaconitase [Coemansia sp. RSA 990]KAJ2673189.1 mitochondrial Homoaconitase [Coemansia sp. RSA 1085]